MRDMLGLLRELLGEPPSPESWYQIRHLFSTWGDEDGREAAIAYAKEHLKEWPQDLLAPLPRKSKYEPQPTTTEDWQLALLKTLTFEGRDEVLSRLDALEEPLWGLQLSKVTLKPGDLKALAEHPILQELQHLQFISCNWHEHMDELRECGLLGRISSVGFDGSNEDGDEAPAAALVELLCVHKALTHVTQLGLGCGFLRYSESYPLFRETPGLMEKLQTLQLPDIFHFDSFETFLIGMSDDHLPHLKTLIMPDNETITRLRGGSSPMMFFKVSATAETLDMSKTTFSDIGWDYFCGMFDYNRPLNLRLKTLDLSSIKIRETDRDEEDEVDGFEGTGAEVNLNEGWCIPSLFDSKYMEHLRVLRLAGNQLTNKSITALTGNEALQKQLEELDLSDNSITQKGFNDVLRHFTALRRLFLRERWGKWKPESFEKWFKKASFPPSFEALFYNHGTLEQEQHDALYDIAEEKGIRLFLG